jgi:hypothetical protein
MLMNLIAIHGPRASDPFFRVARRTVDAQNPALPDDQKIQEHMHLDNGSRPIAFGCFGTLQR